MSNIPILMYHHVAMVPEGQQKQRDLYVTPKAFARQMKLLKTLGFQGMSMTQARPYLNREAEDKVAVITLDDGYTDNLDNALPVLQQYGFSATCYAVSAAPGNVNHWDTKSVKAIRQPLMDAGQLLEWQAAGMEIGAHTRTHPHLTHSSDKALVEEIHTCKAELEDILGREVTQFCYPYGDHDERVVAAVRDAGFTDATTTVRGRAQPRGNSWRWPRMPIRYQDKLPKIFMRLTSNYEDRLARRRARQKRRTSDMQQTN